MTSFASPLPILVASPACDLTLHRLEASLHAISRKLAEEANKPEVNAFDLLCHTVFNAPLLTRRQRAEVMHTSAGVQLRDVEAHQIRPLCLPHRSPQWACIVARSFL